MNRIRVRVRRLEGAQEADIPAYATPGAAGVDLRACMEGTVTLEPGDIAKVPTGLALELPDSGVVAFICARSGLASKYGLALVNGVGVIDSDYRGEVQVALINQGRQAFTVRSGDRIAQMLFLPVAQADFELVEELTDSVRGTGGFGSTGI